MIRASKLSNVIAIIKDWHSEGVSLLSAEDTLGVQTGRLLVFFRENEMLDAYDKPLPEYTSQDFINVALL